MMLDAMDQVLSAMSCWRSEFRPILDDGNKLTVMTRAEKAIPNLRRDYVALMEVSARISKVSGVSAIGPRGGAAARQSVTRQLLERVGTPQKTQ